MNYHTVKVTKGKGKNGKSNKLVYKFLQTLLRSMVLKSEDLLAEAQTSQQQSNDNLTHVLVSQPGTCYSP